MGEVVGALDSAPPDNERSNDQPIPLCSLGYCQHQGLWSRCEKSSKGHPTASHLEVSPVRRIYRLQKIQCRLGGIYQIVLFAR
ncbi:hypothetical protein D3C87_1287500 [compost metagenome]